MEEKAAPARRLRVALAITELNVGGAERCLTNLALGLDRRRFEPRVYSLGPRPESEQGTLVERLEAAGIPLAFLDLQSWRQAFQGVRLLERRFRQDRPEVVQTFLFHANVLGAVAARRARVPAVSIGVRVADPRRRRLWIERFATRHADRIVCVSQATADAIVRRGGFPRAKIVVIPNGIDAARYASAVPADPATLGVPPGRRMIVAVGRLDEQKGLDWLLELAPNLLRQTPHHDLVLVGEGPQRDRLVELARQNGIADRVHFPGWKSNIPSILAASDLLVLASRWEGMPNVVLEAMATGLPVVATRSEGVCELLGEAAVSQTAPFGESQVLTAKIVAFANDHALAARVGAANRRRAMEAFSLRAMIDGYARHFWELVGRDS